MRPARCARVRVSSWVRHSDDEDAHQPGRDSRSLCAEKRGGRRTDVVVPPRELAVLGRALWELRLGHEAVGLFVQAVVDVVAQQEREERRLEVVVVSQGGRALRREERAARGGDHGGVSVGEREGVRGKRREGERVLTGGGRPCRRPTPRGGGPSRSRACS